MNVMHRYSPPESSSVVSIRQESRGHTNAGVLSVQLHLWVKGAAGVLNAHMSKAFILQPM